MAARRGEARGLRPLAGVLLGALCSVGRGEDAFMLLGVHCAAFDRRARGGFVRVASIEARRTEL